INPIYVRDAVAAIQRSLELPGSHKINVGGPEVLTLREIGHCIGRCLGQAPKFAEQPAIEPRHLVGDIRKMSQILINPTIDFETGIRLTLVAQEVYQEMRE
ncbi:MAG: hypothetical protein HY692_03740, partial [Cyanobacteria bacterium NC_groundwater_1444_Ag_S-0.65um_54_12]|nr:hypothetical protein [Cyanobacteria bacterium NC_groundwater_1444_Ag_S-0.65um_54_12]